MPRQHGFLLFEVLVALLLFVLMVLMFTAVTAATHRAAEFGNGYAQAMSLAHKKIDQLQEQGFSNIKQYTPLETVDTTTGEPVIDSSPAPVITGGWSTDPKVSLPSTAKATFSFTNADKLTSFFGTPSGGSGPTGTIVVTPYQSSGTVTLLQATVTISWSQPDGAPSSYQVSAVIQNSYKF